MTDPDTRSTNNNEPPADEYRNWMIYFVVMLGALISAGFLNFVYWYKGKSPRKVHIGLTFKS